MKCIDVIVPVYRGLDETRRCIESVLSSANKRPFELVVINDDSPELAIHDWLNSEIANKPNVTVLTNERNLGFVGTVNRGMSLHEDRDVVLLNSDTEVANDWLDRLHAWTERVPSVGTITPFSNNATICSYPEFCESNELPSNQSVAELDEIFATVNKGEYVEVPTGVGFCMYITRACLNDIGYFDEETFGRGYGEENDFCMRASMRGWKNILAGDVFVFHKGSVSFSEESLNLQKTAINKLLSKHPEYTNIVLKWIREDPPAQMRKRVNVERLKKSGKPGILFVGHGLGGGTYTHIRELVKLVGERVNLFLLEPGNQSVLLRWINSGESFRASYELPGQWSLLIKVLNGLALQRIHYHHSMGHVQDVLNLPAALGLPYDITLHDYYFICPQIHLSDSSGKFCGFPDGQDCDVCLSTRPAPGNVMINTWRYNLKHFIENSERVFCPSFDVIEKFRTVFNSANYCYAPHPVAYSKFPKHIRGIKVVDRSIRVACVGAIPPIKGAEVLEASAIDAHKRKLPVEYILIGYAHRALVEKPKSNLSVHGKYEVEELSDIVSKLQPDVFWFPAQIPETFSYTLSEVFKEGYPVIVTDLGALPERVADRPNSWVKDWKLLPSEWNDFFFGLINRTIHESVWNTQPVRGFDYLSQYLTSDFPVSAEIFVDLADFPSSDREAELPATKQIIQNLTLKFRKMAGRYVLVGHLLMKIPYSIRRKIKQKVGLH